MNKKLIITAVTSSLLTVSIGKDVNASEFSKYITWAPSHNVYFEKTSKPFYTLGLVKDKLLLPETRVVFGGKIQVDPQYWEGGVTYSSANSKTSGSTVLLSSVDLDFMGNLNNWVSAFAQLEKSSPTGGSMQIGRAAIILGDLSKSPFYAAIGQINLQFGSFAPDAGPWANGLDTNAFRPSNTVKQISLGYDKNGLTAGIALFENKNSSTDAGATQNNNINDFMVSSSYKNAYKPANIEYMFGAGYINDMRYINNTWGNHYDNTTKTTGNMFANSNGITDKRLPALDLNAEITFNQFVALKAEYNQILTGVTTTGGANTSLNIKNKRPAAWAVSGFLTPVIYGETTTFWVAYSQTQNMQGLPIGLAGNAYADQDKNGLKHAWNIAVSRSIFDKNNIIALDYQRVENYSGKQGNTYTIDDNYYF